MINMMFKWTKWLSLGLVSLLLLLIIAIATVLFTNPGLKMALWGAEQALPQLKFEQVQGSLFPRFTLKNVRYIDDQQQLEAKIDEATLAVNFQCLLEPKVCVDQLALQGVSVSLLTPFPESPESEEETPPVRSVSTPFPILVNQVSLNDISFDILGTKASWQQFSTAFSMQGDRLVLAPTRLIGTHISLATRDEPTEQTPAAANQAPPVTTKTAEKIVLPEVWIPLNINIQGIDIEEFKLDGESPVIVHRLALAAQLAGHDIKLSKLELDTPEATASLVTEIQLQGDYPLTAQLNGEIHLEAVKGQQFSLSTSGSVAELDVMASFSQRLSGELKGYIEPLDPDIPFDLALNKINANWPMVGESDFQLALESLKTKGSLKGYTLDLQAEVDGTDLPATKIDLSGEGTLEQIDLAKLNLKTLGGELSGQVMANWAEPINWQAALNMQNIQPGLQWQEAEGSISGSLETSGSLTPQGGWMVKLPKLDIDGVLRDYPLHIDGDLFAQDQLGNGEMQFNSKGLRLSHGPNSLSAKGQLDKKWAMALNVAFPELDKTVPDLSGSVQGNINIKGELKTPKLTTDLVVSDINWQQQASIERITLAGEVIPLPQPKADLVLAVRNLAYQDQTVDAIDVTFSGEEKLHQLTLDVISDIASTSLAISGELVQKPTMIWQGKLERVDLESEQGKWRLDESTALAVDVEKQNVKLDAHCWLQANSSLCLQEPINAGKSGEAKLALNQFDFDQIAMFVPAETKLKGHVDADVFAKWAPETPPLAEVNLVLSEGQVTQELEQPITLGWDTVELKAKLANDKLDSDLLLAVKDNGDLKADISVSNVMGEQRKLDGMFSLSTFDLKFLAPLLDEYSRFDAKISTEVAISGDVLHPELHGQFLIEKMQLKGDITPVDINDGQVTANFNGHMAELEADILTPDGHLQIKGDGNWQDLKNWSSNAHVFADDLKVNVPPMVRLKVRPDMTINVTPNQAKVEGDIGIPWGRITVEELPASATGISSDLVIINDEGMPVDDTVTVPFNLQTDVNVKIGDDVKLSAFGLQAGLKGEMNIAQREGAPYIIGEVNVIEGSYRSFGQELLIEEGKILMTGPADQPYVSIKAIRNPSSTQDDVVAGVQVTGPASEPSIEIFSEPAMPQANALSYLLRGQDIDGESGGNAMTTTLIGLSLARTGRVVGEIGQAFGVEDLQLDTAGSGDDSQVTVSGYILPGLQVKYGVGIFDSLGEFTVRYRLMTDLYVEVVSGLDSVVDLLYQFEFE